MLRIMEVVVTTGATSCARLKSNFTTNKPTPNVHRLDALPVTQPTVSRNSVILI